MSLKDVFGYLLGFILFIVLIPALMYWGFSEVQACTLTTIISIVLSVIGIGLGTYTIVYMKRVGKGNPMDAFGHEVAPRTKNLMTDGPYKICRNPMLLGVLIYYVGILILCHSWQALLIFIIFLCVIMVQVSKEEKRLERDFGNDYLEYKRKTKKIIPFIF